MNYTTKIDKFFSSGPMPGHFFKIAIAISLLGIAVYLPSFRNNFFWDDVDFFGGLCESIERGNTINWFFSFSNGHISVIPKIGYWINYLFFNRSIIFWHLLGSLLHAVSITSVFYILYSFLGSFRLTIFLSIIFATSTVYDETILTTNSLNHLCAVAFTLLSLALLCRYIRNGNWAFYFFSVVIAFAAILSTAFGLLVFPAHFLFAWCFRLKRNGVIIYGVSAVLTACSFLLFWVMGTIGPHESHLNLAFGLHQTFLGITKVTIVKMLRLMGIPLVVLAAINIIRFRKNVNWRFIVASLFLASAPLLMSLSFREDFVKPYTWARYHHLPVVGIILFVGLGLSTPNMETTRKYFMPGKVGWYSLIIFFTLNSGYVFYRNLGVPTNKELRVYEDGLGEACIKYTKLYNTNTVYVPNVKTSLPAFPWLRDLIFICRYSTPYSAHLHFKLSSDDDRLIKILNSDRKYEPIRSRLAAEHLNAENNTIINNCTASLRPDFKLHVPIISFNGQSYSADFQYSPGQHVIILTGAMQLTDTSSYSNCTPSTLSSDLKLHIPAGTFDGAYYWADFQHKQGLTFTLTGHGELSGKRTAQESAR